MTIVNPEVSGEILPAKPEAQLDEQAILFVGQMASTGSATPGDLYQDIPNDNSQDTLFGKKSMLSNMIFAFKEINKVNKVDAIPLADGTTAATGSFTITGTYGADGLITFYVASDAQNSTLQHKYIIPVVSTSTPTTIGDALEADITTDERAPFTAANVAGVVTITAADGNKGTVGNAMSMLVVVDVATGFSVANTGMSSGATDPSLTGVFDPVENIRYQSIPWASQYDFDILTAFLEGRWPVDNIDKQGVGYSYKTDTLANLKILGNSKNIKTLVIFGDKLISDTLYKGSAIFELDHVKVSRFVAIESLRLTEGQNIGAYVTASTQAGDKFGGKHTASLPYFNTPISQLPIMRTQDEWPQDERRELREAGISILGNNLGRTNIITDQVVTTYKKNGAGENDVSFKYLNYVHTGMEIYEYFLDNLRNDYSQSRLSDGQIKLSTKVTITNKGDIQTSLLKYLDEMGNDGLAPKGKVTIDDVTQTVNAFFIQNLKITDALPLGKVIVAMSMPIVTQLRTIALDMQLAFNI